MAKYRIHIDPSPPDPEMVERHRDFDALYKDYQTHRRFEFWRKLYRNPRNFGVVIMLVAIGALVWEATEEEARALSRSYELHPPVAANAPTYQAQTISPEAAVTLQPGPEVQVEVPAQAWLDSSGQPVAGPIELRHRLLNGPQAAFVAGVPRPWQQLRPWHRLHLVEVQAYQNQQPLRLRQGYALAVSWTLPQREAALTVRYLDSSASRWQPVMDARQSETSPAALPRPQSPVATVRDLHADTLIAKSSRRPSPPPRPFGTRPSNLADFPALRGYEKVYWAHVPGPNSVDPWAEDLIEAERPWQDVRIRQVGPELYELRFARQTPEGGLEARRVLARPLLKANSAAEAQAWYERQLTQYQQTLAEARRADSLRAAQAEAQRQAQRAYEAELKAWREAQAERDGTTGTTLRYEVPRVGVSGYWVELPTAEPQTWLTVSEFSTIEALQPWCYATQGDTLLPLRIVPQGVEVQAAHPGGYELWLSLPDGRVQRKTVD